MENSRGKVAEDFNFDDIHKNEVTLVSMPIAAMRHQMTGRSFVVEITGPCENVEPELLKDILKRKIRTYLKRRDSAIDDCQLSLKIERCGVETHTSRVTLKLLFEGTFNGKSIRKVYRLNRRGGNSSSAVGIVAVVIHSVVANIANRSTDSTPFGSGAAGIHLSQCIDECVGSIELELDCQLGISESQHALRWKNIEWLSWIVPVAVTFANMIVYRDHLRIDPKLFSASALFYNVPLFFAVRCIGYLVMPEQFFRTDPRGRKAMARSGVQSIVAMRILAAILLTILLAIAAGSIALFNAERNAPSGKDKAGTAEIVR